MTARAYIYDRPARKPSPTPGKSRWCTACRRMHAAHHFDGDSNVCRAKQGEQKK